MRSGFKQDLMNWTTSRVVSFEGMFAHAEKFNGSVVGWDTSMATSFRQMFFEARRFNRPLMGWNTSASTDMREMFANAISKFPPSVEHASGEQLSCDWYRVQPTCLPLQRQQCSRVRQHVQRGYVVRPASDNLGHFEGGTDDRYV